MDLLDNIRETAGLRRKYALEKNKLRCEWETWLFKMQHNPGFTEFVQAQLGRGAKFKDFTRARFYKTYKDVDRDWSTGVSLWERLNETRESYDITDRLLEGYLKQGWLDPSYSGQELADAYGASLTALQHHLRRSYPKWYRPRQKTA